MNAEGEFPGSGPETCFDSLIARAVGEARNSFRYFWREVAWERKRIIPGLDLALVKMPFSDPVTQGKVEHMWISDIDFDGMSVQGKLENDPDGIKGLSKGDDVVKSVDEISDWLYGIQGRAYGGHTIQTIRSRMKKRELAAHDRAWGLDFGGSFQSSLYPDSYRKRTSVWKRFLSRTDSDVDHPMSLAMKPKFEKLLNEFPEQVDLRDDRGWTMLHNESMAGNRIGVALLLDKGADTDMKTAGGLRAVDLADSMGWDSVVNQLADVD